MAGPGQGKAAQAGRAKRALSQANAGLQSFLHWYGASAKQIRGYARHALRLGRFIIRAALLPQLLLCITVALGVSVISLALPHGLREAHIIAAIIAAGLSANLSLKMARLAGQELAEDLRFVLRESPELADKLRGLLAGKKGRTQGAGAGAATIAATPAGEALSLSLGIFLRALRLAGRAASAAGQLAVPGLLDLSRLPFWLAFGGSILLAWLPFVFAAPLVGIFGGESASVMLPDAALPPGETASRIDSVLLIRSSLSFLCSSLACLPPLGMLVVLLVVRRAAAYIGIAEALLDAGVAADKQLKKPEHRL